MADYAWRVVVIQSLASLRLCEEQLIVHSETEEKSIPLEQIREILVETEAGNISFPLLAAMAKRNIRVVFCDRRKNPVCEMYPYDSHYETAGRIMDQAEWSKRKKEAVWRQIVKMKITQQINLLRRLGMKAPPQMEEYCKTIKVNDATNREAMASKLYFDILFGEDFRRFADDNVNAGLNYGYTILCSAFNRAIAAMGYSTALGIHHCNRQNYNNLSCDFMEPFRPFVDRIVYQNQGRELDWEYRKELISLLYSECRYRGKATDLTTAIEWFARDVLRGMKTPHYQLGEVSFAETKESGFGNV